MPAIVEYPEIVKKAMKDFGDIFKNEPEREHFAEYLTGLFVASRKSVLGINSEFVQTTDQSCLNRWLTEAKWDVQQLNEKRLALLQNDPTTKYSAQGVIAIDNVLISHEGKTIEDVGYFWDHADKRHLIAHDYLIVNYVCMSLKHYPLEFRRFRKREQCDGKERVFKSHTQLCNELVDYVVENGIPGDFSFDSYFTNADIQNHIHEKDRGYVGDMKFNRKVKRHEKEMNVVELGASIPVEDRKMVEMNRKTQWYFTATVKMSGVKHAVRIVILWDRKNGAEPVKALVTNRIFWDVSRILRAYRKRWTGTETFHRDGKQNLGMGDCQLRSADGQTAHMYMVFVAYSLLMLQIRHSNPRECALAKLTTIGEACRAILRETLTNTIDWVLKRYEKGWECERIYAVLKL